MNHTKYVFALALTVLSGCAAVPDWATREGAQTRMVKWIKDASSAPFVDQEGICHLHATDVAKGTPIDSREADALLSALGAQVQDCFNGRLAKKTAVSPGSAKQVTWVRTPSQYIWGRQMEVAGRTGMVSMTRGGTSSGVASSSRYYGEEPSGFTKKVGDVHYIICPDEPGANITLGYVMKYVFDGRV